MQAQNFNWPLCDYIETHEDTENFIRCSVDEQGSIFIGNKKVENLKDDLYAMYKYQMKNEQLDFSLAKIEIQVDSSTYFKHVNKFIGDLSKLNMNSIFFVAKSNTYSSIEDIWTIGLSHDVYCEKLDYDIKLNLKEELNIPPMPPPPPWATGGSIYDPKTQFTLKYYFSNPSEFTNVSIALKETGYSINDDIIGQTKLVELIRKHIESDRIVFEVFTEEESTYSEVVNLISIIKKEIQGLRTKYCGETLFTSYENLSFTEQKIVNDKFPYLLVLK